MANKKEGTILAAVVPPSVDEDKTDSSQAIHNKSNTNTQIPNMSNANSQSHKLIHNVSASFSPFISQKKIILENFFFLVVLWQLRHKSYPITYQIGIHIQ